jgi:hypothetical protein
MTGFAAGRQKKTCLRLKETGLGIPAKGSGRFPYLLQPGCPSIEQNKAEGSMALRRQITLGLLLSKKGIVDNGSIMVCRSVTVNRESSIGKVPGPAVPA